MNWTSVWELVKVNILYSNSNSLTSIRKRQEKRPKANFSPAKSMFRQQLMLVLLVMVLYGFLLLSVDYSHYPGRLGQQQGLFALMALLTGFATMYSVFYESNDTKLYVYLPVKPAELFLAKTIASLGMSAMYLTPLLPLFIVVYWQFTAGNPLSVILGLFNFLVLALTTVGLSLLLTSLVGRLIVRSPHRKMISGFLTALASFGAVVPIFFFNYQNAESSANPNMSDVAPLPYFRGFVDVLHNPFSLASLLNYWLELLVLVVLLAVIVKIIMPNYYRDSIYTSKVKNKSAKPKKSRGLRQQMVKHHLSTLWHSALIMQNFVTPALLGFSFAVPLFNLINRGYGLGTDFVGVTFMAGLVFGAVCSTPVTFLGVGLSLERGNYLFLKTLPFNFKGFVKQKFRVLLLAQLLPTAVLYALIMLVIGLNPFLILAFLCGLVIAATVQGQYIYRRDYKYLNLNWQDVNQLFTRGNSQWLTTVIMLLEVFGGVALVVLTAFLSAMTNPLVVSAVVIIVSLLLLALAQIIINRLFWKKLD